MSEIDPEMVRMLHEVNVTGKIRDYADKVRPSTAQFRLAPGDRTLMATVNITREYSRQRYHNIHLVEIVDAAEHAAEFPDFQSRLDRSYVLGRWYSQQIPEGEYGWFSRIELMPLAEERWNVFKSWIDKEVTPPDELPGWLQESFRDFYKEVSETSPGALPTMATCPKCGSDQVQAHVRIIYDINVHIAESLRPGTKEKVYHTVSDKMVTKAPQVHLDCGACNKKSNVKIEDFTFENEPLENGRHMVPQGKPLP